MKRIIKKISKKNKYGKKKIVMVSGGFDPIHIGHIRYMQEAKKLGDYLIVVINNDNWLRAKKGKEFMSQNDRKEILEAFNFVDEVIISNHKINMDYSNPIQRSVCEEIKMIKPHIFANGGDRHPDGDPIPEVTICEELGIKIVYNIGEGGKVRSSSEMLKEYSKRIK